MVPIIVSTIQVVDLKKYSGSREKERRSREKYDGVWYRLLFVPMELRKSTAENGTNMVSTIEVVDLKNTLSIAEVEKKDCRSREKVPQERVFKEREAIGAYVLGSPSPSSQFTYSLYMFYLTTLPRKLIKRQFTYYTDSACISSVFISYIVRLWAILD